MGTRDVATGRPVAVAVAPRRSGRRFPAATQIPALRETPVRLP